MSNYFPVICGEWCLDNSYVRSHQDADEKARAYRALAEEQLNTWGNGAGYFYWNYKLMTEDPNLESWDLRKCVNNGWFPLNSGTVNV